MAGSVVVGARSRALLAALAAAGGRPVADARLIELVWGDEPPANPIKSLHVLVSRTRTRAAPTRSSATGRCSR